LTGEFFEGCVEGQAVCWGSAPLLCSCKLVTLVRYSVIHNFATVDHHRIWLQTLRQHLKECLYLLRLCR